MANDKHPIIAHGELYVEPITKKGGGGDKKIPHEYEEAKKRILADIDNIFTAIHQKTEMFLEEKIVCVRMEPKFEAKSYVPTQLLADENMSIVGGRRYRFIDDFSEEQTAKLYFIKTDNEGIKKLKETITSGTKDTVDAWKKQLGSIYSMDLLQPEEKTMGFSDGWENGAVEIVLHPMPSELEQMMDMFYSISKIPVENTRVKTYEDGLTFISAKCNSLEVDRIKSINAIRAIHPLGRVGVVPMRMHPGGVAPQLMETNKKSLITVGVFDGGADENIPLLKGHVDSIDCVSTVSDEECLAHGSAVCGVVLHGNLAGKGKSDILPAPHVSVESFRVLPIQDQNDFELYEAIDVIEDVVASRKDIKLYNLSFGPIGAIVDDTINRFTYVLDRLTYDVLEDEINPLFCVAVGNDGDLDKPFNRIQSPSDLVNGLGVGAYTYNAEGAKIRAQYSCIGGGREGAKVKPDFLEFGGSFDRPFVLVGADSGTLSLAAGTSFASPLAVNKIGRLMAQSEDILPHIGRTLLLHNSSVDENLSQADQGHGYCSEDISEALLCDDKKVTILYSGTLEPSQTVQLPIFSPKINLVRGMVNISWTITTIVAPYANDPDAYTNNCIEDVFIPHNMTFNFNKKDRRTGKIIGTKKLNLFKEEDVAKAKKLLDEGYKRSEFPASHVTKHFWNETDLRAADLKWDTVIKKKQRMRGRSLLDPALTLHAIDRNDFSANKIQYHVAITIEALNYQGSLYDSVLQNYQNLTPIEIRNINRVMIDTL